jgi:hypothetical protein
MLNKFSMTYPFNERGLNRDVDSSKFIKSLLTSLFQREDCALFGEEGMVRFNGFN